MPLRVFGFSLRFTLKVNMSASIFQWRPNARWMGGLSLPRSRSNNDGALSSCGMKFSTYELLLSHFVSRNPPLERRLRSYNTIWYQQPLLIWDNRLHKNFSWRSSQLPLQSLLYYLPPFFSRQNQSSLAMMLRQINGLPFNLSLIHIWRCRRS